MAETLDQGGLILESCFLSASRVLTVIPLFPFDKYRNLKRIRNLRIPVLVIHGDQDKVIPFRHGQKLFTLAPDAKLNLWVPGGNHFNLTTMAGKAYWQRIQALTHLMETEQN